MPDSLLLLDAAREEFLLYGDRIGLSNKSLTSRERLVLILLLLLGASLLLFRFPFLPEGLHRDEISEAYESYALLRTGADRWGYHLPVYFLSWGSGQNVIQAYLNIPFVAMLGLTRWSVRLLPTLLNVFCLPLFFFAVRRWYGTRTALLALFFLAVSPWHIMLSRWGIENSPLPFFLLLGLWTFDRALGTRSPWRILPALLPFACAMYTYGVVVVMVPLFVPLLVWIDLRAIRRAAGLWIGSLALFALVSAPLGLFTLKNYVTGRTYSFERLLPFSAPLLPHTRLQEADESAAASSVLHHNLKFLLFQFSDNHRGYQTLQPWFSLRDVHSVQTVITLLALFAFCLLLWRSLRARRPVEPFVPWLLSCCIIFKMIPLNTSRATAMYLPILALGAFGFFFLLDRLPAAYPLVSRLPGLTPRTLACGLLLVLVLWPLPHFLREYDGDAYTAQVSADFLPHMPEALAKAHTLAGTELPIYLSEKIRINYVDVLYYDRVDPLYFQHSGATWNRPDFGQYRFQFGDIKSMHPPFVYILPFPDTDAICPSPRDTSHLVELQVGVCP